MCSLSHPSVPSSVSPEARAGVSGLALSRSLGPSVLSPLCWLGTAVVRLGSRTVLAFMRRQKGGRLILDAHRKWGWLGLRHVEQSLSSPINCGNRPTGVPAPSNQTHGSRSGLPPVLRSAYCKHKGRPDLQEFRSGQRGSFSGLTQSSYRHGLGASGGRLERKGPGLRIKRSRVPCLVDGPFPASLTTKSAKNLSAKSPIPLPGTPKTITCHEHYA